MPKHLIAMLLSLLAGAALAAEPRTFAASTTGELVVDAEGRVISVKLDHKELGEKVMTTFEQRMHGWRFEPVIVDGLAVPARAAMRLDLLVKSAPGQESLSLEVRNVQFNEPPGADKPAAQTTVAGARGALNLTHPRYPAEAVRDGVGSTVWLLVRFDAEGRASDVATHSAELRAVHDLTDRDRDRHAGAFMKAAERAAKGWKLPGVPVGTARIPVRFRTEGDDDRRWALIVEVPREQPVWMADEAVVQLNESGEPGSDRFRLLTALN